MFCPNCGTQLPDGSAFCTSCGTQLAPEVGTPTRSAGAPNVNVSLLISKLLPVFFSILTLIFGFLPLFKAVASNLGQSQSESSSLFNAKAFDISVCIGIAKILMIVQIVLFAIFLITRFLNVNKFVKLPVNVADVSAIAYFIVYFAALILTLIGSLTMAVPEEAKSYISTRPAVCWYFALVFIIGFAVTFLMGKKKLKAQD